MNQQVNGLYSMVVDEDTVCMATLFALLLHLKSVKFTRNLATMKLAKLRTEEIQAEMNRRGIPKDCNTPAFKMEVQKKLGIVQGVESQTVTDDRELRLKSAKQRKLDMSPRELRQNLNGNGYKRLMLRILEA